LVEQLPRGSRQAIVEGFLGRFEEDLLPRLQARPRSVIHNDGGNQHNMILGDSRVGGIIDFGDAVRTHRICGLGIAAAYATFGTSEPLHAIGRVARGYHRVLPLDDDDLALVTRLAAARLSSSVCLSNARAQREPDNEYAVISAAPAWRVLERLAELDLASAAERIREAIDAVD
jgi:Ser/Thr protein kinase RdoA (MazF antagonist)